MFNNSNGSGLSIEFDLLDLHERFNQGELGIEFPKFMENPKTIEIFENEFVDYVQEKANSVTDDYILEFIDAIMDKRALWINYQVNIMVSLFKSAVVLWLNGEENLDKIIISHMKFDFLYELVEVMKEMYDGILDGQNDLV